MTWSMYCSTDGSRVDPHVDDAELARRADGEVDDALEGSSLLQAERKALLVNLEGVARGVENLLFVEEFREVREVVCLGDEPPRLPRDVGVGEDGADGTLDAVWQLGLVDGGFRPYVDGEYHWRISSTWS
jgi:hypothetical protein